MRGRGAPRGQAADGLHRGSGHEVGEEKSGRRVVAGHRAPHGIRHTGPAGQLLKQNQRS